ncbi:hypothetical protein JCM11251_000581 [Rhodosporidiobolus azoricus]
MTTLDPSAASSSLGLGRPSSGKAASRHPRQSSGAYQVFDPAQVQTFREAFSLVDQDNDGLISEEDLRGLLESLGQPASATHLRSLLSSIPSTAPSSTSKGGISFTSFVTLFSQHLSSLSPESELLEAFASFDEGNTGFVKVGEVREWLGRSMGQGEGGMSEEDISRFLHPPFLDPRTGLFNYRAFCATLRVTDPEEAEAAAAAAALS